MRGEHEIQVVSATVQVGEQRYTVTPGTDGRVHFNPPLSSHAVLEAVMNGLSDVCTWQGHRWKDVTQVGDEHRTKLCIVCGETKETF